jgi:hypothetical protein
MVRVAMTRAPERFRESLAAFFRRLVSKFDEFEDKLKAVSPALAASVRARLTDLARKQGVDYKLVLTRYAIDRLLYRLTRTEYAAEFVLKGRCCSAVG